MAQFLHCSMAGSYQIDCEVLEHRMFDPIVDGDQLDALWLELYGKYPGSTQELIGVDGYVVKYYDFITEEEVTRWVQSKYVEL